MCKSCAAKLSPWFSDRRQSTVDEIKEQLDYREANRETVSYTHLVKIYAFQKNMQIALKSYANLLIQMKKVIIPQANG